jgi:hypothetical protein
MKFLLIIYIILLTAYLSTLIYQVTLSYMANDTKDTLYRILLTLSLPLSLISLVLITMLWGIKI